MHTPGYMDQSTAAILSKTALFKGISPPEIVLLFEGQQLFFHNYKKGAVIAFQGDDYTHLILLLEGKVSAAINDFSGKTLRVETIEAPAPLASGILFAENPALPVTVSAVTKEVKTLTLSRKAVINLLSRNHKFLFNFMEDMGNKIVLLADKIALFRFKTLKQKICGFLLSLEERQRSASVTLPYTKEVLSELFGVARPSLSRAFVELEETGVILLEGRTVHLLNKQVLLEETLSE